MNRSSLLQLVEIFQGAANQAEARVYAQLPRQPESDFTLSGTIRGPSCRHAHTLAFDIPLVDRGSAPTILAEALVPDPCFWTMELPFLYEAELELRRGGEVVERLRRIFGMRRLGVRGPSFYFQGERWVLRGAHEESVAADGPPDASLPQWREQVAGMVVVAPNDGLCRAASAEGVLLAAHLPFGENLRSQLRRLARHPAVAMAIISGGESLSADLRAEARNVILVQPFAPGDVETAAWAHAVMIDAAGLSSFAEQVAVVRLPIIASRRLPSATHLESARRACDFLQRDLAPIGDFAGYLV